LDTFSHLQKKHTTFYDGKIEGQNNEAARLKDLADDKINKRRLEREALASA